MDDYICKSLLRSGNIKEYCFLNQYDNKEEQEEGFFSVKEITPNAAARIGIQKNPYGIKQLSAKVGAIWLDKGQHVPMVVQPKIEKLDAIKMYLEITEHADLFATYHSVFQCWPEEKAIAGVTQPDVTLLQVAIFLKELSRFCQRDLRQGFVRVRQNLTGKVKGKILIAENLRRNTLNAREDRVFCQYHIMSLDTPANRILKTALTRCYRYLGKEGKRYPKLLLWARQCNAALSTVPESSMVEADFRGIIYSGLMRKYQRPHQYARMILKRLRTDATGNNENWTVPYVLDMNRLFEGYVGVLLSRIQGVNFKAQESTCLTGNNLNIKFIPDYHEPQKGIVVDAKYKSITSYQEGDGSEAKKESPEVGKGELTVKNTKPNNADIYQLIAYCKLLEEKKFPCLNYTTAALAVPVTSDKSWNDWNNWCQGSPQLTLKKSDITLYVLPCPIPIKTE